jgi:hypothetical protein
MKDSTAFVTIVTNSRSCLSTENRILIEPQKPCDASVLHFELSDDFLESSSAGRSTDASRAALARLCHIYSRPVYSFIRRNGHTQEEAQDLTQSFFTLLIEKEYVRNAEQARGRFLLSF